MAPFANAAQMYLISITILQQSNRGNLRKTIREINNRFENFDDCVHVRHTFKVSGEPMIIAVVDVLEIVALENVLEKIWNLGSVDIKSDPILHYETFARNIGVAERLLKLPPPELGKDNLYWLELNIEYHGKSTGYFLDIWKKDVEFVLTSRAQGEKGLIFYKSLGQRKMHLFINSSSLEKLDKWTFDIPVMVKNGDNVLIRAKRIQFLEEYNKEHYQI